MGNITSVAIGERGNPLTLNELRDLTLPVLSVGQFGISPNSSEFASASRFIRVDVRDADHWSFFPISCQIRENVLAADPPQDVVEIVSEDWPGCAESDISPDDAQELLSRHANAFFKNVLVSDKSESKVQTTETVSVSVSVSGGAAGSDFKFTLTDPTGRSIGVDPITGDPIDDFNGRVVHSRPNSGFQTFTFPENEWGPGDYQLDGFVESEVSEVSLLLISNGDEIRELSRLTTRTRHHDGAIPTGTTIPPITFQLTSISDPVPEPKTILLCLMGLTIHCMRRQLRPV